MDPETKRTGRPTKAADPGTRVSLGLKVTAETKAKLDALARESGRTQSQEAEAAIERGHLLGDLTRAGPAVGAVLQEMLRAASATVATLGDPTESEEARNDLRGRWVQIAQTALPVIAKPAPSKLAAKAAVSAMRHAAWNALLRRPPGGLVAEACVRSLGQIAAELAYPGLPDWPAVEAELQAATVEDSGEFAEDVQTVLLLARAADRAFQRAESRK